MKSGGETLLYGIFGHPLGHTLSPPMQEAAFRKAGIQAFYLVFELGKKEFSRVMRAGKKLPLAGFNVTVPYKEAVMRALDRVSPEARAIGAANTVAVRRGRWHGTNTDAGGFLLSLKKDARLGVRGLRALVLGAGGSARAVVYALAREGARSVTVAARRPERARRLVRPFADLFPRTAFAAIPLERAEVAAAVSANRLIVNATPVGLKRGGKSIVPPAAIPRASGRERKVFYDLVYRPAETDFLRAARKKGHRAVGGLGMLLYQGALAFEFWTGCRAPAGEMKRALERALEGEVS